MRGALRLVVIALLGVFLALPAVPTASALPASADPVDGLVVQPTTPTSPSAPTPTSPGATAPSGPKLEPDTEAEQAESKRKLIMGVTSAVLIGLVVWGRSVRRKRRKALEGK